MQAGLGGRQRRWREGEGGRGVGGAEGQGLLSMQRSAQAREPARELGELVPWLRAQRGSRDASREGVLRTRAQ